MGLFGKSNEEKKAEAKERNRLAFAIIDSFDDTGIELVGSLIPFIAELKEILAIPLESLPKGYAIDNVTGVLKWEAWRLDEVKKNKEARHLCYVFKHKSGIRLFGNYKLLVDNVYNALLGWELDGPAP